MFRVELSTTFARDRTSAARLFGYTALVIPLPPRLAPTASLSRRRTDSPSQRDQPASGPSVDFGCIRRRGECRSDGRLAVIGETKINARMPPALASPCW